MNPEKYLIIPAVSSENRKYIPIGFQNEDVIPVMSVLIIPYAGLYHFGILTSNVHMAWMRAVCGRLESRYRYSKDIVYNNFLWPNPTEQQILSIEKAAQGVLDARSLHPNSSLAVLYNPLTMPLELLKAHRVLDREVCKKYYRLEYKNNIFENFKIKDKNERLLMMLKYLHAGEKTRSEIADDFGISERTVADNLAELQDGFTFLGTEMKIHSLQRGTNKYKSHIHPVFLALNSSEIYSLTVGLKMLSKNTVFEDSLGRIANVIYEQLSQSSKDMIDDHKNDIVRFGNDSMKFIDSRRIGQISDKPFAYFLKEPLECTVSYIEDGNEVKSNGLLKLAEPSIGNIYDKVILDIEEGSINLDIEDIISITRADKDIYFKDW